MKTELTKEQSKHLIDLGVPREKASNVITEGDGYFATTNYYPIFTLTDLLKILKSMKDCDFTIKHWKDGEQDVWTGEIDDCVHSYSYSDELIDVIYKQTICAIKYGYLKFD